MYKYEYVKLKCKFEGWGGFAGNIYRFKGIKTIIESKAKIGFRYVGFIPTKQRGTGHIEELVLVFEKKVENTDDKV